MIKLIIILLLVSIPIQAEETKPVPPSVSKYSFTHGTVGNQVLNTQSSRMGKLTTSYGSLGGKPLNTSTIRLGRTEITTGTVGNEPINIITITPRKD